VVIVLDVDSEVAEKRFVVRGKPRGVFERRVDENTKLIPEGLN
jgi:hypothetical protein